ncbi:MAG: MCP four helix bundle domain-containing protein [Flavobacterium sp.]|nr:MCP four helix bundle domain-containing protein [Flavobacterium sp.]
MRWTYSIKNKLVASLVLLALCLLVLLSNYLDRIHTQSVKASITTMYEDRLIVEEYILKMTRNVYQIREILQSNKESDQEKQQVEGLISEIKSTYQTFSKTRLTENEQATAEELIAQINLFEKIVRSEKNVDPQNTNNILSSLSKLSNIQLDESKLIMKEIESQYATIKASSEFAFAIVLIILIVLQILVFSGESLIPMFKPKDPTLN